MGRHSASYIAAQQGLSTAPTFPGAANYVGRVGALALAMGIGAAVVGGAGFANAEVASDSSPKDGGSSGGGAQAAPDPTPAKGSTNGDTDAQAGGPAGLKTGKPSALDVPKMVFGGGVPTRHPGAADPDSDSLPGVLARIPNQISAALSNAFSGAGSPTSKHDTPQGGSRGNSRPAGDVRTAQSTTTGDDPVASFVRARTDDLNATFRAAAKPADVQPSAAPDVNPGQRLAVSSFVVTPSAPAAPAQVAPVLARPIATLVAGFLNSLGYSPSASTGGTPVGPFPILTAALQLIHRELEHFVSNVTSAAAFYDSAQAHVPPANAPDVPGPSPEDETPTAYGDIGKWMLQSDGRISNYGGQPYGGKTLLEPVNVIIVDPTSKSPEEAAQKLNTAMFFGGFPAQPIHSTGFQGDIDDVTYGQQPTGLLQGFSDNLFIFPNDHGRIFGPDRVQTSTGYVWSGAFSTEELTIYNYLPAHAYVSSDMARTALATRLILSGQATYVGMVPLNNAYNTATTTTGDHDGYAVVLQLR